MRQIVVISIFFTLLTACSSKPTKNIDFDLQTNFTPFTSYQYSSNSDISLDANPIMINRIQTAIDKNLRSKGFTKHEYIDQHSADLTIHVSFSEQEKQNNSSFSIGLGTSVMGSNSRSSIGINTTIPINSDDDTIVKVMIDMSNIDNAVWHGSDCYQAKSDISIEQTDLAVYETVSRLLAQFPPEQPVKLN